MGRGWELCSGVFLLRLRCVLVAFGVLVSGFVFIWVFFGVFFLAALLENATPWSSSRAFMGLWR